LLRNQRDRYPPPNPLPKEGGTKKKEKKRETRTKTSIQKGRSLTHTGRDRDTI